MGYPIYKKDKYSDFKTFYMILSADNSICIDTESLSITNETEVMTEHAIKNYEDATPSEFELAFTGVTKSLNHIITTTKFQQTA